MKKLTGLAVVSLAVALFAQDATNEQDVAQLDEQVVAVEQKEADVSQQLLEMQQKLQAQQDAFGQQLADLEQKLQEATSPTLVVEEEVVVVEPVVILEEKTKKYPKIKQSGDINFIPRIEINTEKDFNGDKNENLMNGNVRRFMLAWNYRFLVEINEKLEMGFRLSDPEGGQGETVVGSGKSGETNQLSLLKPALPNAWFTWKPASVFSLSGGLVNVASNTALDLSAVAVTKNPTRNFSTTFYNSLAGFELAFPITPDARVFVIGGLANNENWARDPEVGTDSYSNGKFIFGANLSFAESKICLKPAIQVLTRGDDTHGLFNSDSRPLVTEGIDMGFKVSDGYSLNLGAGAAHDWDRRRDNLTLFNLSAEPVFNFGGENGKFFNFRVKYGFFILNDSENDDVERALVQYIDTRLGIAVNEKFSIVPRYRLWTGNCNGDWQFDFPTNSDDKSSKSLHRFEFGFAASF